LVEWEGMAALVLRQWCAYLQLKRATGTAAQRGSSEIRLFQARVRLTRDSILTPSPSSNSLGL
jgi:hypothetical protein